MSLVKVVIMKNTYGHLMYVNGVLVVGVPSVGDEELVAAFETSVEKMDDAIKTPAGSDPHKTVIRWGSEMTRQDNEGVSSTYNFETKAERDAFMYGVEEAIGWSDYELVEDEEGSVKDGE